MGLPRPRRPRRPDRNKDRFSANARAEAKRTAPDNRMLFFAEELYSKENGVETSNRTRGGANFEQDIAKRLFLFENLELEQDRVNDIDLLATATAGLGYFIIKQEDQEFKARAGAGYKYEKFITDGTQSDIIFEVGETYRKTFAPWLEFTHSITLQPAVSDLSDYRAVMENAGEIPLTKDNRWKFRIGIRNEYTSKVPEDVSRLDTFYFANLVIEFK